MQKELNPEKSIVPTSLYKSSPKTGIYHSLIKRPMDFIFSLTAIILLSPVFLLIAVLIRIKLGKPVLFKQKRPGLNEKIFVLYKFRTMTDKRDENGALLPDGLRLTKFGKFLRFTSLDELPELYNILRGDMSMVGPRPLLVEYLPYYSDYERLRHRVRPGLSGLAQVSGRNYLPWEDRLLKDIQYVCNVTFINDMKIILATIIKIYKKADVAENAAAIEGNLATIRKMNIHSEQKVGNEEVNC